MWVLHYMGSKLQADHGTLGRGSLGTITASFNGNLAFHNYGFSLVT